MLKQVIGCIESVDRFTVYGMRLDEQTLDEFDCVTVLRAVVESTCIDL